MKRMVRELIPALPLVGLNAACVALASARAWRSTRCLRYFLDHRRIEGFSCILSTLRSLNSLVIGADHVASSEKKLPRSSADNACVALLLTWKCNIFSA